MGSLLPARAPQAHSGKAKILRDGSQENGLAGNWQSPARVPLKARVLLRVALSGSGWVNGLG
jgi:hypothetical protein